MKQLEYARQMSINYPDAPASWMTNLELYNLLTELADLRTAIVFSPHPVEEAVEIERAIDAQLPYTRVFNSYLTGGVRYPEPAEVKAQADAVCEEYEEAHNISNNFNFDTIKEIPF